MGKFNTTPYAAERGPLTPQLHRQTYRRLRRVMMVVAVALPVVLWMAVPLLRSTGLAEAPTSMSAFYHTEMRDVFVGALCALGMCLFAYKGYNDFENTCLTVSGFFLAGVALFPVDRTYATFTAVGFLHYACAITFFVLVAAVCVFARGHGLGDAPEHAVDEEAYDHRYAWAYNTMAALMVSVLVVTVTVGALYGGYPGAWLFWLEAWAIWVFAGYWFVKTRELDGLE